MNTKSALNVLPKADPRFRELRVGEFGYLLADLETKTVHISNLFVDEIPCKADRFTTSDFGELVYKATEIFKGDELKKVVEEALLVFNGHFDGTF